MLARKVRRLLQNQARQQRGGGGSRAHALPVDAQNPNTEGPTSPSGSSAARRLARTFTFISGRSMTPLGCDCLVTVAQVHHANDRRRHNGASNAAEPTTKVLRRRRTVLPGVAPGELLRTRAHLDDCVTTDSSSGNDGAIPQRCHSLTMKHRPVRRGGDRTVAASPNDTPAYLVAEPRRALPCPAASSLARCQLCPWMAVGEDLSSSLKSEVLRSAMDPAVQASEGRLAVTYLDPFTVPAQPNFLQEAELRFVREDTPQARATDESIGTQGRFVFVSRPHRPSAHKRSAPTGGARHERHGRSETAASVVPRDGDTVLEGCLLATLEQKRLAMSLTRWAAQLPASMRNALDGVYISQPTLPEGPSAQAAYSATDTPSPWHSALLVTLAVHKDVERWGPQSPLCGPSHPDDVLSVEEQKLIDAVMEAAPLIEKIAVHVMFGLGEPSVAVRGAGRSMVPTASVGKMDCLYPVTARGVTIADALRLAHSTGSAARVPANAFGPMREVMCYGEWFDGDTDTTTTVSESEGVTHQEGFARAQSPRRKPVPVPGLHSSVLWLGLWYSSIMATLGKPSGPRAIGVSRPRAAAAGVHPPPVPLASFWRHPNALDAAGSILFSALLPDPTTVAGATTTADQVHVRVLPPSIHALTAPEDVESAPAAVLLAQTLARVAAAEGLSARSPTSGDEAVLDTSAGRASEGGHTTHSDTATYLMAVLNSREDDTASLLLEAITSAIACGKQQQQSQESGAEQRRFRVLLAQCAVAMQADLLGGVVGELLQGLPRVPGQRLEAISVDAGVVDVDPLSAAFVAFAVVEVESHN